MSASSKFDLSSSSPDRPLYTSGQRGSYAAASLDRSGSFRENMDSPTLPAVPNTTRTSSAATQADVAGFLQCLRFDPKLMVSNHKLNRPVDFKRLASLSLGVPGEDSSSVPSKGKSLSSPSPEDFRRLKTALRESCTKARERVKIFNESLSGMNKLFPTIPSRKRSRSDGLPNDRSNLLYSTDRSVSGSGVSKIGAQNQPSTNGFEVEQKSEERSKPIPNKRTRTSMVDPRMEARATTPARPSGVVDRDREILKTPNAVQSEERMLPIDDGWEKSKMKKKRSGIKSDIAASSATMKPVDGPRDSKQGMQQRLLADPRTRPGVANGGVAKVDGASQQTVSGMRSSIYRAEQENSPLLQDKKDRTTDKERVNLKTVNKSSAREDFSSGGPTSSTKLNASARAPRSGPTAGPKMSPLVSRPASVNDWELPQCTSKLPAPVGVNSRKRTPSMRSSSPPVAQWASHRPQKISRTARRSNFIPIVQSNDESTTLDTTATVGNERRFSGSPPHQVKLKSDNFSPAALSESEESGTAEMKSKEKTKKSDVIDEKTAQNVQKLSNLMLPPRKSKVINAEDHGDGVRRQGRTGRGFTSTRSVVPLSVEKLGNVGTAKQLRSARLGLDKTESKIGRPPSRKLSDRKAYTRQKHSVVNAAADFLVGSDDGHEELLAAANAVTNPAQALSSSFWKQMEPIFRFVSDVDLAFLNQQVNHEPIVASSASVPSAMETASFGVNGFGFNELGKEGIKIKHFENYQEHLAPGIGSLDEVSLYQRLIAAIIPEGDEELCYSGNEALVFDVYEPGFELEKDIKSDSLQPHMLRNCDVSGRPISNGYRINANGKSFSELEYVIPDDDIVSSPDVIPSYDSSENGLLPEQLMSGSTCAEFQYNKMSINERLLLEIHCIGIYPEVVPDTSHTGDGDIAGEISRLNEKYHDQVSKRKDVLNRLLKSASETGERHEREFEQNALDKLVAMAYDKYMSCWGPSAHGMKSASGKMAKQAALAFVKRTLERCQEFEDTGKSCFNESLFRDMFLSGVSRLANGRTSVSTPDSELGKLHGNTSSCLNEVRASGAQQSPLTNQEIYPSEAFLSSNLASSDQIGKEETWSSRVKKKELLLDDVGGSAIGTSPGVASGIGSSFMNSAKGKRSERDREGKGSSREVLSRGGTTKTGRPASANIKGERKSKTKLKQKTTQLSASVNGLLGKMSEKHKGTLPSVAKSSDTSPSGVGKDKNEYSLDDLEDPIDLSGLQLPEMDMLGGPDDFEGQGQDIGSWLNIDDDGLQDHDFMGGLEIPMDDLADLNMMV